MMWLITVGVLVVWCVVYTYEYYEDKMSSEPGCADGVVYPVTGVTAGGGDSGV